MQNARENGTMVHQSWFNTSLLGLPPAEVPTILELFETMRFQQSFYPQKEANLDL